MPAILFGSISTVADTSELQREAFNLAFEDHGLRWRWHREQYVNMLSSNGGRNRILEFARSRGDDVDADAVHRTKSERFRQLVRANPPPPRAGVTETMSAAHRNGQRVALVTTTSPDNIRALLDAVAPALTRGDFDVVVDATTADASKPDPASYRLALTTLGVAPGSAVAIEDNVGGVAAASAAGVTCVAFPNANTAAHDFGAADRRADTLDPDELVRLASA